WLRNDQGTRSHQGMVVESGSSQAGVSPSPGSALNSSRPALYIAWSAIADHSPTTDSAAKATPVSRRRACQAATAGPATPVTRAVMIACPPNSPTVVGASRALSALIGAGIGVSPNRTYPGGRTASAVRPSKDPKPA